MKMTVIKKRTRHNIECKLISLGTDNGKYFYFRFDSEFMSDKIRLEFTEKEELWLLHYLTIKNEKK